jgi:hypothetical protein
MTFSWGTTVAHMVYFQGGINMAKMPDFSELSKKIDLQGILDTVKSAIGGSPNPEPVSGDEIAVKLAELKSLVKSLATTHTQQGQTITKVNRKIQALEKDINNFRNLKPEEAEAEQGDKTSEPPDER